MINKAVSKTSEYCVTRIAVRFTPPTFLVEYKVASQNAILSALSSDIYHIEIVIGGLTPASNPSGIAKILIENCGILRQSSSTSAGVKFPQIVRLCQKLVERQGRTDSCFVAGIQHERKDEVAEKLSSKCAHVIKDGFQEKPITDGFQEKPITDEHTPPIPCIFLPQQKKNFDNGCENSTTITKNCEADPYKGREILFPSSYATKMSFCGPNTEQPACKVAAKRYSEDRSKKGDSLRIKESNEESVSKAMRPVESTNRSHLHDSSSSSQNWLTDCFGNSTSSESKRNFSKAQVLPTSIDVSMERYARLDKENNNNFAMKIPSCQTTSINVKQSSDRTTRVPSDDYSNYSEAFEEETTTAIRTFIDSCRDDDIQGNITDSKELVISTQKMVLNSQQHAWVEDKPTPGSCRHNEIENHSEQQLTEYTIETELETNL
jgi:hypothetical protein